MRRRRSPRSTGTGQVSFIELERRRFGWLIERRRVIALCVGLPLVVTGFVIHNEALVMGPVSGGLVWVFMRAGEARPSTTAPNALDQDAFLPPLTLVWRSRLTEPAPVPTFVGATHPKSPDPWYHGGGVGLTMHGVVTANNGRNQAGAWEVGSRAVPTPAGPQAPVAELAVVGYRDLVRRVHLLDGEGRMLASLPSAGLDGRRLSALALAAGIHYSRYEVDRTVAYESSPVAVDCFPRSPSYVRFDGPAVPVAVDVWADGERDTARP